MFTIENLKFTKFFDVKSPVGLEQRGENICNYSIGMDLYFPRDSKEFREAILKANQKLYPRIEMLKMPTYKNENCLIKTHNFISSVGSVGSVDNLMKIETFVNIETNEVIKTQYYIYRPIQIPTGIGLLIPDNVWAEVRTKSSNFQLGFSEVHGTVDMNYTYGMGVQIFNINTPVLNFESDQKFTQIVFHEAVPIVNTQEVPLAEWDKLEEVQLKRNIRTGGFGSTGKKDK